MKVAHSFPATTKLLWRLSRVEHQSQAGTARNRCESADAGLKFQHARLLPTQSGSRSPPPATSQASREGLAAGTPDVARQNCAGNPGTKQMGPGVRESRNLARFNKYMCPEKRKPERASS